MIIRHKNQFLEFKDQTQDTEKVYRILQIISFTILKDIRASQKY